jgi:hypothetical protein
MNRQIPFSHSKMDKVMSQEQFEQIVAAIINGKYSWACVLILRFAGYNPLHYIPYRTYNRLLKENCQVGNMDSNSASSINTVPQSPTSGNCLSNIKDLTYLEVIEEAKTKVHGGGGEPFEANCSPRLFIHLNNWWNSVFPG